MVLSSSMVEVLVLQLNTCSTPSSFRYRKRSPAQRIDTHTVIPDSSGLLMVSNLIAKKAYMIIMSVEYER